MFFRYFDMCSEGGRLSFMMRKKRIHPAVDAAHTYVGYTALADNRSQFGRSGLSWDGAFIDEIFKDLKYQVPNHQYSASALAFYAKNGRLSQKPKVGDVVFFGFPPGSGHGLEAPHVGIVSDTSAWKEHRSFKCIEGQTNTGLPRGPQEHNGVYERIRYEADVLTFARPARKLKNFAAASAISNIGSPDTEGSPSIRVSHLTKCSTSASAAQAGPKIQKSVELVQLALAAHPAVKLQNADRGVFNLKTRRALSAFQRYNGALNPDGTPDVNTLRTLSAQTGDLFQVGE